MARRGAQQCRDFLFGWWLCVWSICLTGCSDFRDPLTPPSRGGPAWRELTSAHFVMSTDLDDAHARAEIAQFEHLYEALRSVWNAKESSEHVRVVIFERQVDYREFTPEKQRAGHFVKRMPGDPEGPPALAFSTERDAIVDPIFLHELAHRFNHQKYFSLPVWLDEGLADYASSLTIDGNEIRLGGALWKGDFTDRDFVWSTLDMNGQAQRTHLPVRTAPSLTELMASKRDDFMGSGGAAHYLASYKVIQFLRAGPSKENRARFATVLAEMEEGTPFLTALGNQFDTTRLEHQVRGFLLTEEMAPESYPLPAQPAVSVRSRQLSEGEVHLLWGELASPLEKAELARRELDAAVLAKDASAEGHYARAFMNIENHAFSIARTDIERALASSPNDPRFLFVRLMCDQQESAHKHHEKGDKPQWPVDDADLVDRLEKNARTAIELELVATARDESGRVDEGLAAAERSTTLDPLCARCFMIRGWLFARKGKLDKSLEDLDRALSLMPDETAPKVIVEMRKTLIERIAKRSAASPQATQSSTPTAAPP